MKDVRHASRLIGQEVVKEDKDKQLRLVRQKFKVWNSQKKKWSDNPRISYLVIDVRTNSTLSYQSNRAFAERAFSVWQKTFADEVIIDDREELEIDAE